MPTTGSEGRHGPSRGWHDREAVVLRFEQELLRGERPRAEEYLDGNVGDRAGLLVELLHVELEVRLKAGESARVEEYLARFPELAAEPGRVAELVLTEYRCRRRAEPELTPDEYAARFPRAAD